MRPWVGVAVLVMLASTVEAQVKYSTISRDAVLQRLNALSADNNEREAILKRAFETAGCHDVSEQSVKHTKQPNVICVMPGEGPATIVVGAHLDKVHDGSGAVDDWSGAAMLASLVEGLAPEHHKHRYVFIAFSGEEEGLLGSEFYVKQLAPADLHAIVAMVNLECLGLNPTEVWYTHSDRTLVGVLAQTTAGLHLPLIAVNVDHVGTDDSDSFKRRKIPNITLHSLTQETWKILHSRDDTIDKVNTSYYYDSYRLVAAYLAVLDTALPMPEGPAASTK